MSSLWTPEGEHRVGEGARRPPEPDPGAPGGVADPDDLDAEEEAGLDLDRLEAELLAAPAEIVIANHCYGLFQLAALHLGRRPPNLEQARLAIDALGAVVEALGERLGESLETLRDGLAQLRLAYVQIAAAAAESPPEA